MKLYLASLYSSNFDFEGNQFKNLIGAEKEARLNVKHYLESYHYINKETALEKIRRDGVKVFLDSGAFSAFTKGVEINLQGYCDYIKQNEDIIEKVDDCLLASVLDGIGDPLKTWQNQQTMESYGVRPLPCFHYGEDERYLNWYVANYEYITLGGMVPITTPQLVHWLDRIWEQHLTDGSGHPKLKVHGFGLTSTFLMERYPWYSVDSSAYVQAAANGELHTLNYGRIAVAANTSSRKIEGRHLNTFSEIEKQAIIKHISDLGFDITRLEERRDSRVAFNIKTFTLEGLKPHIEIFKREQQELF